MIDKTHDWNQEHLPDWFAGAVDETIRDGLQAPRAPALGLDGKLELIGMMEATRISDVIVGMVARSEADAQLEVLLTRCREAGYQIQTWVLSRSRIEDLEIVERIAQRSQHAVGMNIFLSLSEIRQFVEGWRQDESLAMLGRCLAFGGPRFPRVRVALEDATRTRPEVLERAAKLACGAGVTRLCIADTAGVATPEGVRRLFGFLLERCAELRDGATALEWHGHNDRGLAVANTLEAIASGARYVHGTMLGIGERNGNAALDTVLLNLRIPSSRISWPALIRYYDRARSLFEELRLESHPYLGTHSFATSTGTHCAAIHKAMELGRPDLAKHLFSPPSYCNDARDLELLISPISGRRAALAVLAKLGVEASDGIVDALLGSARRHNRTLTEAEVVAASRGGDGYPAQPHPTEREP